MVGIPESQLETWTKLGAQQTAKDTHESIRKALRSDKSHIKSDNFDDYLQGSYRNNTNIRGDSDVDIIIQLNKTFWRDISKLSPTSQAKYIEASSPGTYSFEDFRTDVFNTLVDCYPTRTITQGNKSIKVKGGSSTLNADVVPCLQYRNYTKYNSDIDQEYVEGIKFYTKNTNEEIINYPKIHHENGVTKNSPSNTNGWYKKTIRMFKNARTRMIEKTIISQDLAPSYFLECMLYNVPDSKLGSSWRETYANIVNWLSKEASLDSFVCQNEQLKLFGNSDQQWDSTSARTLIDAYIDLWNDW